MIIYVTRHGQTDWNIEERLQGVTDIELNEEGIRQAQEIYKQLENTKLDLIISSPLKRAYKTAEIIKGNRDIPIVFNDKITERRFGSLEGQTFTQVDKKYFELEANITENGVEGLKDFYSKVTNFLDEVKTKYKNKSILLVTHGGTSIPIELYFNGNPNKVHPSKLRLGNCEIRKYEQ